MMLSALTFQQRKWVAVLGLKYAASTIIYLSKSKEKDGKEVVGNIIIKAKQRSPDLQKKIH